MDINNKRSILATYETEAGKGQSTDNGHILRNITCIFDIYAVNICDMAFLALLVAKVLITNKCDGV